MEDHEILTKRLSDWQPETDPTRLKALGKTSEEVNELGGIVARCIIQGIGGNDPETGKPNRIALEDEIADVRAFSTILIDVFGLDEARIIRRARAKIDSKLPWIMGTATDLLYDPQPLNRLKHPAGTVVCIKGSVSMPFADDVVHQVEILQWETKVVGGEPDVTVVSKETSAIMRLHSQGYVVTEIMENKND